MVKLFIVTMWITAIHFYAYLWLSWTQILGF